MADPVAITMGAPTSLLGSSDVASMFSGRAKAARIALLGGLAGLVRAQGGTPKVAFDCTVVAGKVTKIEMIVDYDVLGEIDIDLLGRRRTAVSTPVTSERNLGVDTCWTLMTVDVLPPEPE